MINKNKLPEASHYICIVALIEVNCGNVHQNALRKKREKKLSIFEAHKYRKLERETFALKDTQRRGDVRQAFNFVIRIFVHLGKKGSKTGSEQGENWRQ
jgi:hypothetical protein